jgi:hypothetical protein
MKQEKVISIILGIRPEYTKTVFEYYKKCIDIENYSILTFIEPTIPEVTDVVKSFKAQNFCNIEVNVNKTRLDYHDNFIQAINKGFERNNYIILGGDDIIYGEDALIYFEKMNELFQNDPYVLTASGYNYNHGEYIQDYEKYRIYPCNRTGHLPWGFAMWKNSWDKIWNFYINNKHRLPIYNVEDTTHLLTLEGGYTEIRPVFSRANNIGKYNSRCFTPETFENVKVINWAETRPQPIEEFHF